MQRSMARATPDQGGIIFGIRRIIGICDKYLREKRKEVMHKCSELGLGLQHSFCHHSSLDFTSCCFGHIVREEHLVGKLALANAIK